MDNIKKNISLINLGILSLIIKILAFGGDIPSAIVLSCLSGIYAFKMFLDKKEVDNFQTIRTELNEIKEKDLVELKSALTALKLNNGVKKLNETQAGSDQKIKRYF